MLKSLPCLALPLLLCLGGGQMQAGTLIEKGITLNPNMRPWRFADPNPDGWFAPDESVRKAMIDRETAILKDLRVKYVRLEFLWSVMEPARGQFDWRITDYIAAKAKEAGFELVPQLVYAPGWAAPSPIDPPANPADYVRFVQATVERYKDIIHYWEIWNEPDITGKYFAGDAASYVKMLLKPGYVAAKAADGNCHILLAGISQGAGANFLAECYEAGAAPFFDIANYHYYGRAQDAIEMARTFRDTMDVYADGAKPLWATTGRSMVGSPTTTPTGR